MFNDDSDILKSLTTIYGFFFVFMSVVAVSSSHLRLSLQPLDILIIFMIIILMSFACASIGFELLVRLGDKGLHAPGLAGFMILAIFMPVLFVLIVGKSLFTNWYFLGYNMVDLSAVVVLLGIGAGYACLGLYFKLTKT
ncbi:MAG: hypothetical protein R6V83_03675 [Candidatus Thorarchaeota archaeon]